MTQLLLERSPLCFRSRTHVDIVVQWSASAALHLAALAIVGLSFSALSPPPAATSPPAITRIHPTAGEWDRLPRIVFRAPRAAGGGGGGGGNRERGPIRRAEGRGRDAVTLRTRHGPAPAETAAIVVQGPAVLLDARPLASGDAVLSGLPSGGVRFGTSLGPGAGGGVGTGHGTGIGRGDGPGIGPGSGGGTGGGAYQVGNGVTAPRLVAQTTPRYTADALEQRVQGAVCLSVIIAPDGTPYDIRITRSLEPGLDAQAIAALRQWRFVPGTLRGVPVDVEVAVVMDFWIR
jgi:TonB family protein